MAEALSLAASVIAVIGLAGQVVQGCQNIKGWVGDFNNAPSDIQQLMRELDSIQESAKTAEKFGKNGGAEIKARLEPALQLCFDAVEEIRKKIVDADSVFKEKGSGKRARGWHRLKVVFGKQDLQDEVDRLSRAKADLGVAQSNVLLHLSQSHQEQLTGIGKSLALGQQTSQNSASILGDVHEATKQIHSQVVDTATAVTSLSSDMRSLIEVSQQSRITPYMVAEVERAMQKVLQKQAFRVHQESARAETGTCLSVRVAERDTPHQELSTAHRGPHYHSKQELVCRNPLLTISKTTSTAKVQLEESEDTSGTDVAEPGPSYESITTYEVRVNLGLWRRGLKAVIGHARKAYMPGRYYRLRTFHIVGTDALVFQAVRALDIVKVQALFSSGQASPFDQMPWGESLFDCTFDWLFRALTLEEATRGLKLVQYILDRGGTPNSLDQLYWIGLAISVPNRYPENSSQVFVNAIRLMFKISSHSPFSKWSLNTAFTIDSAKTPVGQFFMHQDQWPLKLGPAIEKSNQNGGYSICETDRQISEDEDGLQIAPFLPKLVNYTVFNDYSVERGICSILALYENSAFRQRIHTGCRNRITILLRAGYDPQGCDKCRVTFDSNKFLEMSVTQYSLWTNTSHLWQEALENFGWSRTQIRDLLDEELYRGFAEFLDGELEFRSQAENREEFLQKIAVRVPR